MSDIQEILDRCHKAAVDGGWWHDIHTGERLDRNKGELLALIHSEISEAYRGYFTGDSDDKLPERPNAEVEMADAVIRIGDYAGGFGYCPADYINIEPAALVRELIDQLSLDWDGLHALVTNVLEDERKSRDPELALGTLLSEILTRAHLEGYDLWGAVEAKLAVNAQRSDHKPANRAQAGGKRF